MNIAHLNSIAASLSLNYNQVEATAELLAQGGTIAFIARYRKEATGSIDELAIEQIRDLLKQLDELDTRRQAILKSIETQGKLTDELKENIENAASMAILEDLYLPYKLKRRTRATMAREKGLEPLAEMLWLQDPKTDVNAIAAQFVDTDKQVATFQEALAGARDIMAERVSEHTAARELVRGLFGRYGVFKSRVIAGKEQLGAKYKDYFEAEEKLAQVPSHRMLAMRRAEAEEIIYLEIETDQEQALESLNNVFVQNKSDAAAQLELAIKDGYTRLLRPSIETEMRLEAKKKADLEAIRVFAQNLRQLLMAAPMGQKRILAIDPGFKSGCKLVCLDAQGGLVHNQNIYPHEPQRQSAQAGMTIKELCNKFEIQAIAIGNGTAGRETESFVRGLGLGSDIEIVSVNESGASVYSASQLARDEFGDYDLTVRGAVSIGRRLMDPLAELVKIDAKAIGVGQYQHDVDQNLLKDSLDDTVASCVNAVGVQLNTASRELLSYVSGVGGSLAGKIVEYRNQNGPFESKKQLLKVPRLGEKAFEQAAGFLRISDAKNPLDASAVHPESYFVVELMAKDLGCSAMDFIKTAELRAQIKPEKYISDKIGLPTLKDIISELAKPGRDPRQNFESFSFEVGVEKPSDLYIGQKLSGIITNVTNFGAFVDIGVHQDGLVHISHLADRYVATPSDIVRVADKVQVTVLEVDLERKRIALSMKADPLAAGFGAEKSSKSGSKDKRGFDGSDQRRQKSESNDKQSFGSEKSDMASRLAELKSKFSG